MSKNRRGMIVKNTNDRAVSIQLATRRLVVEPGTEELVTAEEVKDAALRESLQIRAISIVRPATEQEENAFHGTTDADDAASTHPAAG